MSIIVTVESLIAEAEGARVLAMKNRQIGAAVSAITAKAKLAGLWPSRSRSGRSRSSRK